MTSTRGGVICCIGVATRATREQRADSKTLSCPKCGRDIPINHDGYLRWHTANPIRRDRPLKTESHRGTRAVFSWDKVSLKAQRELLDVIGDDGHTIWSADGLKEDGVDAYIVDAFTRVERSDGSHKGSIYAPGASGLPGTPIISELRGVYGLTVLRSLAAHYDVHSTKFGRGSEARDLTDGISIHLKEAGA